MEGAKSNRLGKHALGSGIRNTRVYVYLVLIGRVFGQLRSKYLVIPYLSSYVV